MKAFDDTSEYLEILKALMEHGESEIVEFKEAKGQYSTDKIGAYFSALSNEVNLREKQYGWLILGVSEKGERYPVGTAFKQGDSSLLQKYKYEIAQNVNDGSTFTDIVEVFPEYEGTKRRVLMFKIPAATTGIPTSWKNRYYARSGESLVPLQQHKIDEIRMQERRDWSKQFVEGATTECLDANAIALARENYKKKMNRDHISEEIDQMTNDQFLQKRKLVIEGKVTNAAMVLLGKAEYDYLMDTPPTLMWRLFDANNEVKDYQILRMPFLIVVDEVFARIRNLTYRYMTDQLSLFPRETEQYDNWLLRELLNNCIAHSNYQLGGRIYIDEFDDHICISNPGSFIPRDIETVLNVSYSPPFYRNQRLADAMVDFNMIDTATMGIRKVYRIQKQRYFPMPDYNFSRGNAVSVTVYGKVLDDKYTYLLYTNPDLSLETVYLLDQVQKGKGRALSNDAIAYLRKNKLVEGRKTNLFLSAGVAQSLEEEAEYIKNKGFTEQYYKDLIVDYLCKFHKAKRKDFRKLLWDKLPDSLNDRQKERKILTLLTSLRKAGIIMTDSPNKQHSYWVLAKKMD